jgi:serine/arginine repetitive matrix protein 2
MSNASSAARTLGSKKSSPTTCQRVFIIDPERVSITSIDSVPETSVCQDNAKRGIVALRKYYALKDEAKDMVTESR